MVISKKQLATALSIVTLCYCLASGQKVSFETPMQWVSYRSDTITVKAHLDTANIKQKQLALTLLKFENGKKSKIESKTIAITNYTHDVVFKPLGKTMFGGKDFLILEWSIPKNEDKGSVAPIGVLNIAGVNHGDTIFVRKTPEPLTLTNAASLLKDENYRTVGGHTWAPAWNKGSMQIVCKKNASGSIPLFCFDIKNAKNAFASYPDRFIAYIPAKDTLKDALKAWFYAREFKNDTIAYTEKVWNGRMSIERNETLAIITMPMYDLGFLPFDGRCVGFAAFEMNDKSAVTAAIPKDARQMIPGSWGNVVLKE
jgi:hypothetical protein